MIFLNKKNYIGFVILFLMLFVFLFYILKTIGFGDSKWQIILFIFCYLPSFYLFKQRLDKLSLYIFLTSIFVFLFVSFLAHEFLVSVYYFVTYIFLIYVPIVILTNNIKVDEFYKIKCVNRLSFFILSIAGYSIINIVIGLDYRFPFTVNSSIIDLIWAAIYPVCLFNSKIKMKFLLFFVSILIAILHDADALVVLNFLVVIYSVVPNNKITNKIVIFLGKYYFIILCVLYSVFMLYMNQTIGHEGIYIDGIIPQLKGEDVEYYKRIGLIIQGYYFSQANILFGAGFGVENYLVESNFSVSNTPQILPLTINIYGGLISVILMLSLLSRIFYLAIVSSNYSKSLSLSCFFVGLMFTIHEYVFNPMAMVVILIISLFSKIDNIK